MIILKKLNVTDYKALEEIRINNKISRIKLSGSLDLTPAAVTKIIKKLSGLNLIENNNILKSTGGRPEKSLKINHKYKMILGINFGPEFIETALSYLDGELLYMKRRNFYIRSQEKILRILFEEIDNVLEEYGKDDILGIGLALHGTVNREKGISIFSPHFGWKNLNIQELIEKKYSLPVIIDNDVRAMAIAEHEFGRAQNTDNFLVIHISNGIGGAIFLNGKTYEGADFSAGEIGHITAVENSSRRCSCGKYGCLEAESSDEAIKNKVLTELEKTQEKVDITLKTEDIYKMAAEKKEPYFSVVKNSSYEIGKAVGNLLNILNIKLVIVAGRIVNTDSLFFNNLNKGIKKNILDGLEKDLHTVPAKLYDSIGIYGAFSLVTTNLFKGRKLIR